MSQEHKDKISAAKKGKPTPWLSEHIKVHGFKKGQSAWNKGMNIMLSDNLSKWREDGGDPWNKGLVGVDNPNTGRKLSDEGRKRMSEAAKKRVIDGKCNLWKGGVRAVNATERRAIMDSFEYKQWRKDVFSRDDYTCQICQKRGGVLHADHIKPFATNPELRTDLANGRTLCAPCHRKTDTYGSIARKQSEKNADQ